MAVNGQRIPLDIAGDEPMTPAKRASWRRRSRQGQLRDNPGLTEAEYDAWFAAMGIDSLLAEYDRRLIAAGLMSPPAAVR